MKFWMRGEIPEKIMASEKVWRRAAELWRTLYAPYVPRDTGRLERDVAIEADKGGADLVYRAPYARFVYEGGGRADPGKQPLAGPRWDQRARGRVAELLALLEKDLEGGDL